MTALLESRVREDYLPPNEYAGAFQEGAEAFAAGGWATASPYGLFRQDTMRAQILAYAWESGLRSAWAASVRAANTQAPAKPTAEVAAQVSQPFREAK